MAQTFNPTQDDDNNQDWTQWMQWDGNQVLDSTSDSLKALESLSVPSSELSKPSFSYPVSPTTTNDDFLRSTNTRSAQRPSHELPTPSHSSGSPESTHGRNTRLSGETLWDPLPIDEATPSLKRKYRAEFDAPQQARENPQEKRPVKKRPHNIVEKRYRANLNDKIAELRDSVPSLRLAKKAEDADGEAVDDEDLQGLAPSNKLNKASILTKAVEYIRHLELRTKRLEDENMSLKKRLLHMDKMMAQGGNHEAQRTSAFTSKNVIEPAKVLPPEPESSPVEEASTKKPIQGLIPVPEAWRKLRENMPQEHYGHVFASENRSTGRKWPTRMMLGSLAGLMVMEGFSESSSGTESKSKGLFGIPLELLDGYGFLYSPKLYMASFYSFCKAGGVLPLMKGFFALSAVAFLIFTYLFNSKPSSNISEVDPTKPKRAPSPASPIEVRQKAWLTSSQILKLPHHSFFAEWMALTVECLKYMALVLLGSQLFSLLSGKSREDEQARVKAWDIAIDAQLAGGDPEIRRSRVVHTIFASGLLPKTPARRMIKALHCRVLLWRVGSQSSRFARFWNRVGIYAAEREWLMARQIQEKLSAGHPDALPSHLAFLLQQPCHEIMTDGVVQRAYNLMFGRPTAERTLSEDALLDVVVEDHAIRGPLDAVSAWWSSQALQLALVASPSVTDDPKREFFQHLESALKAAPPISAAYTRAAAAKAVFLPSSRPNSIETVKAALQPLATPISPDSLPNFIDSSTPCSAREEILTALRCAEVLSALEQGSADETERATEIYARLLTKDSNMTLLGFAAASMVLQTLADDDCTSDPSLYPLTIHALCSWSHDDEELKLNYLGTKIKALIDRQCSAVKHECPERRKSRLSLDSGYGSSDESLDTDFSDV
ncbi:MAG: hypothetical protein Q9227_006740 [Pyrenula ochraceoflavens]